MGGITHGHFSETKGNTAQSWWCRCAARFFVRLYRNDAAGLVPSKEFLCKMTGKMQADVPPSRQAGFVRCCLKYRRLKQRVQRNGVPIAGTVTEIIDKFAVPLEFARKNGIPEDLRPIIRISYQTPEGTEQLLQMRTPDVSPYAPVGRIVPLRYVILISHQTIEIA